VRRELERMALEYRKLADLQDEQLQADREA
jgi:hypothetical protein